MQKMAVRTDMSQNFISLVVSVPVKYGCFLTQSYSFEFVKIRLSLSLWMFEF